MSNNEVWVYIEQNNSAIAEVSLELLSKARELASKLKVKTGVILLGEKVDNLVEELYHYGADTVYKAENKALAEYTTLPYAHLVCQMIREYKPQIVLYGATTNGRDIAPRVASELKTGLTADCTELQIGDYSSKGQEFKNILYQIRPAFGGNIIATIVSPEHRPQMATVREGVMKLVSPDKKLKGKLVEFEAEISPELVVSEIVKKIQHEKEVDLKAASIIVAAGMGVGSKEGFDLVKKLAHELGGQVAASRAAVDAGFIGHDYQVGQTGTTVRPTLYVAVGISGQIQHIAGMNESNRIIAINNDSDAPIFKIAHYGIVGDFTKVVPKFIEAFKSLKK